MCLELERRPIPFTELMQKLRDSSEDLDRAKSPEELLKGAEHHEAEAARLRHLAEERERGRGVPGRLIA